MPPQQAVILSATVRVNSDNVATGADLERACQDSAGHVDLRKRPSAQEKTMNLPIRSSVVSDGFTPGIDAYHARM